MDTLAPGRLGRWFGRSVFAAVWGFVALAVTPLQAAQSDPPGRVGRLAGLEGPVSLLDAERGSWQDAERNRPLTSGDRLATGASARAELRVGSTVLRMGERSEIELSRLDDEHLVVRVHRGSVALRLASRETAEETELVTGEARVAPVRAGLYRIDRRLDGERDRTLVQTVRGSLRIDGGPGVETGERLQLWREGSRLRHAELSIEPDEFADWMAREERRDARQDEQWERSGERRVSPEMTGVEELERYGRWESHPEHRWVWVPLEVAAGWAPYRDGRWVWLRPWGWTWVDRSPWGFAPFHYGRWVQWHGRWAWWPGEYTRRPVYAPALVAWAGTPQLSVSVHIGGGPGVGWAPLGPRDRYRPWYHHSERHIAHVEPWYAPAGPVAPGGPIAPHRQPTPPDSLHTKPVEQFHQQRRDEQPGPVAPPRQRERPAGPMLPQATAPAAPMPAPAPMPVVVPPRPAAPAPAAPPPMATPPRGERGGIGERLFERSREAASREAAAREAGPRRDADDDRKQAPSARPGERREAQR